MGSLYQKGSRFRNPHLRLSVAGTGQKFKYAGGLAKGAGNDGHPLPVVLHDGLPAGSHDDV